MRTKVKVTKLTAGETQYISLVKRAANMIPFRIQKAVEGDTMLDLMSFARVAKGDMMDKKDKKMKKQCSVSALVVKKSDDMDGVKALIKKAGYSVDKMIENVDGSVVFAQEENFEEGSFPARLSENLVVVTKSYEPWMADIKNFSDRMGMDGYYECLTAGTRALNNLIPDLVYKAESHDAMMEAVSKAADDFAAYAKAVCAAIPPAAYHLDNELSMVAKAAKEPAMSAEKEVVEKGAAEIGNSPVNGASTGTTVADGSGVPGASGSGAKAVPDKVVEDGSTTGGLKVPGTSGSGAAAISGNPVAAATAGESTITKDDFQSLFALVKDLGVKIDGLSTVQKAQEAQIAEATAAAKAAVQKADDAEKKLETTVSAPPVDGDAPVRSSVKKSDDDTMGEGYWDSALHGRRR